MFCSVRYMNGERVEAYVFLHLKGRVWERKKGCVLCLSFRYERVSSVFDPLKTVLLSFYSVVSCISIPSFFTLFPLLSSFLLQFSHPLSPRHPFSFCLIQVHRVQHRRSPSFSLLFHPRFFLNQSHNTQTFLLSVIWSLISPENVSSLSLSLLTGFNDWFRITCLLSECKYQFFLFNVWSILTPSISFHVFFPKENRLRKKEK